jgi:glycosyltransferase involved in cell wall biosynthesis
VKIAIDISRLATTQRTGTERYTWEVLAGIAANPGDHEYILYSAQQPTELPELPSCMRVCVMPFPRLWTHLRLAWQLWRDCPDVLFVPSHVLPWNVRLVPGMRVVTTVHDLGFLHFPEAHTRFQNGYLRLSTWWAAMAADAVIAISAATAHDLRQFTGIVPQRVHIIAHGVSPRFVPSAAHAQPWSRYLLYVGTLQPRKNLIRLIEAFAQAVRHPDTQLVIAGRAGWLSEPLMATAHRCGVADRVHLIGFVPDADLPALLATARAFVFPSLYEGFGMPVLEAMASGVPVITSNTSALPEVAGDAALLVDPTDVAAIAAAITRLDGDDGLHAAFVARGLAHAARFTWRRCAQATYAILTNSAS